MNKLEPMSDEQIAEIASTPAAIPGSYVHSFARAIEAAVNQKWEEMLSKQEPVAYMTEDDRVAMRSTVETCMPKPAKDSFHIPLYATPVMTEKQEPVGYLYTWVHEGAIGHPSETFTSFADDLKAATRHESHTNIRPVFTTPVVNEKQEPVAYRSPMHDEFCNASDAGQYIPKSWEPLYASPYRSES